MKIDLFQIYHGIAANPNYLHTYTHYNNLLKKIQKKSDTTHVHGRYMRDTPKFINQIHKDQ